MAVRSFSTQSDNNPLDYNGFSIRSTEDGFRKSPRHIAVLFCCSTRWVNSVLVGYFAVFAPVIPRRPSAGDSLSLYMRPQARTIEGPHTYLAPHMHNVGKSPINESPAFTLASGLHAPKMLQYQIFHLVSVRQFVLGSHLK